MTVAEKPIVFFCGADHLLGMLHAPERPASTGVLVVVGGPQYRVGSHRQFVVMARTLARSGVPVLRFDCRGMGDSEGIFRGFEYIADDIRAAMSAFREHQPGLTKVVLWGLCDSASANLFYGPTDDRVAAMVLVNPWARTETGFARAHFRHYYLQRLTDASFWRSVLRGEYKVGASLSSFAALLRRALGGSSAGQTKRAPAATELVSLAELGLGDAQLPSRMLEGFRAFAKPVLFLLSGNDLTAREFEGHWKGSRGWRGAMRRGNVTLQALPAADHTYSTRAHLDEATRLIAAWIGRL